MVRSIRAERYRAGALPKEEIEHLARRVALAPIEAAVPSLDATQGAAQ
jgi:hypothetical protein